VSEDKDARPDFDAIIEGAIDRKIRENLTLFLWSYDLDEDGEYRRLLPDEVRLIRSAVDAFLADNSFANLGVVEFRDLGRRLAAFAANDRDFIGEDATRMRNTCFDAMACIKALEARLAKEVYANEVLRNGSR